MSELRASLIVPARNEDVLIKIFLERLEESVSLPVEVLIVVDSKDDSTLLALRDMNHSRLIIRPLISTLGTGPANAIKFGIASASTGTVVVTMADGSDDPRNIDDLIRLIERGCVIAAASRYMPGGQQIGGPRFKKFLSRNASRILRIVGGLGIHDATNSFKGYSLDFIRNVGIESNRGFEIGLELTAKAHRRNLLIAEVPTIWIDRNFGDSNFQLKKWLPHYLKWFFFAFGKKLTDKGAR
jgi:glycosyltransferase involved in cell wall biosynthesis